MHAGGLDTIGNFKTVEIEVYLRIINIKFSWDWP